MDAQHSISLAGHLIKKLDEAIAATPDPAINRRADIIFTRAMQETIQTIPLGQVPFIGIRADLASAVEKYGCRPKQLPKLIQETTRIRKAIDDIKNNGGFLP